MSDDLTVGGQSDVFSVDSSTRPDSIRSHSIEFAVAFAIEAVVEDYKKDYRRALFLYKEAEKYFLYTINNDVKLDSTKDMLRKKLKKYQDRAVISTSILDN